MALFLEGLRGLLPRTKREGIEFLLDLSPLLGVLVFRDDLRKLFLVLSVELLCLQGFVILRILTHGMTRLFVAYRDFFSPHAPSGAAPSVLRNVLIHFFLCIPGTAALACLGIVIIFNLVPFIFLDWFLMAAATGNPNPKGGLFLMIQRLSPPDATALALLLLPTARRVLLWTWRFFSSFIREKSWRSAQWQWMVLGLPANLDRSAGSAILSPFQQLERALSERLDRANQRVEDVLRWPPLRVAYQGVAALLGSVTAISGVFLFCGFLFLMAYGFSRPGGVILVIATKAFLELWLERVLGPSARA